MTAATIVPRHVSGGTAFTAPSEKMNLAGVGIGGVAHGFLRNIGTGKKLDWDGENARLPATKKPINWLRKGIGTAGHFRTRKGISFRFSYEL